MQYFGLIMLLLVTIMLVPNCSQAADKTPDRVYIDPVKDPVAGGPPFRRLFLDATIVEQSESLTRQFHSAEKYKGNPVVKMEHKWEGWGPYLYGTVLQDQGKLRMWYSCIGNGARHICYAESPDGIHWEKPKLGIFEYEGSKDNNIIRQGNMPSVIKLKNPPSPDKKYALFCWGGDQGPFVSYSQDGIHFTEVARDKLFKTSDVINFFFDPYHNRYVVTYKTANRRHRACGLAVSSDGLTWTKPIEGPVFGADDLDPDATQIYGMPVFPYQGLYIGTPWMYHSRFIKYGDYNADRMYEAQLDSSNLIDVQMAWSWNLISWNRTPDRKPFIALGRKPEFDWAMILTSTTPVVLNDKLYFYYGAFDRPHDAYEGITGSVGLATLRLDGFCSMQAEDKEGWFISRREVFKTPKVAVNAKTAQNGYVTAEIYDRNNNVVKGFSRTDCVPFTGDSVHGVIEWKTKSFPSDFTTKDKKIKFYLQNAEMYSYLPSDVDKEQDEGYSVEQ